MISGVVGCARVLHVPFTKKSFQRQLLFREKEKEKGKKDREYNTPRSLEGLKWNDDIPRLPPGD